MSRDDETTEHRALTGRELRALAHPLRVRLLELLREGPSTASLLAQRLNESTGATSYHLRELHRYGFIDEETGRGRGRERWWKRRERVLLVGPTESEGPETQAAYSKLRSVFVERDAAALERFVGLELSGRWRQAAMIGNWSVAATPEEIEKLTEDVVALVDALRRPSAETPPAAKPVHVSFRALPQAD